jgi:hypothetical protein
MTEDNLATRPTYPEIGAMVFQGYELFGKVVNVQQDSDEITIKTEQGPFVTLSWVDMYYEGGDEYQLATQIDLPKQPQTALEDQIGGDHYKHCAIQPVEFIEANHLEFLEGCVIKRLVRHNKATGKGREDIEKAIHELQLLLEIRYPE